MTGPLAKSAALGISAMCMLLAPAFGGAILYWDGDGADVVGGGVGTWDTTLTRWSTTSDGTTYQAWNNANNDDAVFSGVGGLVTPGAAITANSLTFTVTGYTVGVSGSTPNPINLNSGSGTLTVEVQGNQAIINALYDVSITTIVKNGTGLFSTGISQPSTGGFTGKWIVNAGILSLPGDLRLGSIPADIVPDLVTLNGGTLRSSTANVTFNANRGITLGAGGGGVTSDNTTFTWNGPITGIAGGSFTKRGSTNLILTNNTNNYDGLTTVAAGRLTVGAANALGSSTVGTEVNTGAGLVFSGATTNFTIAEPIQISGMGVGADGGAISVVGGANVTLSGPILLGSEAAVTVSGDSTVIFSNANAFTSTADQSLILQGGAITTGGGGTINGGISLGIGGLTKQEDGRWTLGGLSVYTGLTTVNAGTLIVSGTISGTAQVDVSGTLGGTGTIAPGLTGNINLLAGGKLAPGIGAGTLTAMLNGGVLDLTAGVTPANSLALLFELLAPGSSDKLVVSGGAINIGVGVLEFDDFNFSTLPGFVGNGDYLLIDGTLPLTGTLGPNLTGTVDGLSASLLLADGGKDIVLHLVPEPSVAIALLGGAATLLGLRRRR